MSTPPIAVHRLAPERRDDYLRFFDHDRGPAFADNPEWARCYCHYYHVPKELAWGEFTATQNRVAIGARIDAGEHEGYLGYAGDEVVGWLNVQPYSRLPHACARIGIGRPALPVHDFGGRHPLLRHRAGVATPRRRPRADPARWSRSPSAASPSSTRFRSSPAPAPCRPITITARGRCSTRPDSRSSARRTN